MVISAPSAKGLISFIHDENPSEHKNHKVTGTAHWQNVWVVQRLGHSTSD